jgi:glycosyltransferase involved in cell wall biosynthesis
MSHVAAAEEAPDDSLAEPRVRLGAGKPQLLMVTTIPETFDAFLVPYAGHFRRLGWTVQLAAGPGQLSAHSDRALDGFIEIPWSRSFWTRRHITQAIGAFRRVVRDGRYDIVHFHTPIAASLGRAAIATLSRNERPSVIYTAHGFHFGTHQAWYRQVPFLLAEWVAGRYTDQLIVINETDHRNAERLRITRRDRIVYLPGIGIDLDWYTPSGLLQVKASCLRERLGLRMTEPLFSIIAGLHPGKGHAEALHALALLRRTDAHLAFAGTGILQSELQATIDRLEIRERVHLLGEVADIRPVVLASTAMVLPSFREGLSRAVLEALALGVPVIGSDIRGIRDTVLPDGGILVRPGDVQALADALATASEEPLLDDDRRSRIRNRLEPYSIDALLPAHEALYRRLLVGA